MTIFTHFLATIVLGSLNVGCNNKTSPCISWCYDVIEFACTTLLGLTLSDYISTASLMLVDMLVEL